MKRFRRLKRKINFLLIREFIIWIIVYHLFSYGVDFLTKANDLFNYLGLIMLFAAFVTVGSRLFKYAILISKL